TTFADGSQIQTANSDGFDVNPWPGLDFLHAALAAHPLTLYHLHRWREDIIAPPDKPRYLLPPGEEFRYFNPTPEETEFGMRRQISTGRFRRTESGANVPTLKGAFGLVWPMLPPMSFIYKAQERRRAKAQLDAAIAHPPALLVDPTVTYESPYRL